MPKSEQLLQLRPSVTSSFGSFSNGPLTASFLLFILLFSTINSKTCSVYNFGDNHGPLVSEATSHPTEPQPLSKLDIYFSTQNNVEKQTIFLARTVHHLIGKRVLLLRHSLKELSTHATLNCFAQIFWPIVAMLYCCCLY